MATYLLDQTPRLEEIAIGQTTDELALEVAVDHNAILKPTSASLCGAARAHLAMRQSGESSARVGLHGHARRLCAVAVCRGGVARRRVRSRWSATMRATGSAAAVPFAIVGHLAILAFRRLNGLTIHLGASDTGDCRDSRLATHEEVGKDSTWAP